MTLKALTVATTVATTVDGGTEAVVGGGAVATADATVKPLNGKADPLPVAGWQGFSRGDDLPHHHYGAAGIRPAAPGRMTIYMTCNDREVSRET